MKEENREKLLEKLDFIISLANDNELFESYPTIDIIEMVRKEFDEFISSLHSSLDTDHSRNN